MTQIECRNLSLCYNRKQVVENLSFAVQQGDFLCIVGENGSGKSTLLKGLLGLKKPSRGSIVFGDGVSPKQMGYLPQQENSLEDFPATVTEIVRSGFLKNRLIYTKQQKLQAKKAMETMGISGLAKECFSELSGGQKQRVLLARAFGAASNILILDEPINGLDPVVAQVLYECIAVKNKQEKTTVIMVSHDVKKAMNMANKILHLGNHGTFFGTPWEYAGSEMGQAFLKGVSSCG